QLSPLDAQESTAGSRHNEYNPASSGSGTRDERPGAGALGSGQMPGAAHPNEGPPRFNAAPRRHIVKDGDTLSGIAEKFLGSADRASELYELNRGALPNPDLLPIGTLLKLPPRQAPVSAANNSSSPRLVPIVPM